MNGLKTAGIAVVLAALCSLPGYAAEKIIASTAEDGSGQAGAHFEITENEEERRIVVKSDPHFGYYTNPRYQEHNWYPANGYDYVHGYGGAYGGAGGPQQHRQQGWSRPGQGGVAGQPVRQDLMPQQGRESQQPEVPAVPGLPPRQGSMPAVQGLPAQQGSVPAVQGLPAQQGSVPAVQGLPAQRGSVPPAQRASR